MRVSRLLSMRLVMIALSLVALAPLARAATTVPAATGKTVTYTPKGVLPFIEDDYTRALAEARARKVPLFIESWAPW
jgi:hypothetical protein